MAALSHSDSAAIVCEILASRAALVTALTAISPAGPADVGQAIRIRAPKRSSAVRESVIILHLPAAVAASQHPAWCLACRLACFCPDTRVSVLVRGEAAFDSKSKRATRRSRRAA